jgi:hypothetical protein
MHVIAVSSAFAKVRRSWEQAMKMPLLLDRKILLHETTNNDSVVLNDTRAGCAEIWHPIRKIFPAASFMNFSPSQLVHKSALAE